MQQVYIYVEKKEQKRVLMKQYRIVKRNRMYFRSIPTISYIVSFNILIVCSSFLYICIITYTFRYIYIRRRRLNIFSVISSFEISEELKDEKEKEWNQFFFFRFRLFRFIFHQFRKKKKKFFHTSSLNINYYIIVSWLVG